MADPFKKLYDDISSRKEKPRDYEPYEGGNGRIDRAVQIILNDPAFPKAGALLDVGGATGNLGYALRDRFHPRWTLDISDVCEKAALAKGNKFLCANVDVTGFNDNRFGMRPFIEDGSLDLIVALDFIEHIVNPEKFADECHRTLRPGGRVLINTPNIQYWRHLHSLVVDGIFPHTSGDPDVYHGGHVAFYNLQDMSRIFARFEDHRMHTDGLQADPPPPIWYSMARYGQFPSHQLSYADLIVSFRKPL